MFLAAMLATSRLTVDLKMEDVENMSMHAVSVTQNQSSLNLKAAKPSGLLQCPWVSTTVSNTEYRLAVSDCLLTSSS